MGLGINKLGSDFAKGINKQRLGLHQALFDTPHFVPQFSKDGGMIKSYEEGGQVVGPGTGTSDSIPAQVPAHNFIIPAEVVQKYGKEFFDRLLELAPEAGGEKMAVMLSNGEYNIPASLVDLLGQDFFEKLISEESGESMPDAMGKDMEQDIPHLAHGGEVDPIDYKKLIEKNTGIDKGKPYIPNRNLPGETKSLVPTGQGVTPRVGEGVAVKEGFFKTQEPYKPNFTTKPPGPGTSLVPSNIDPYTGQPVSNAFKTGVKGLGSKLTNLGKGALNIAKSAAFDPVTLGLVASDYNANALKKELSNENANPGVLGVRTALDAATNLPKYFGLKTPTTEELYDPKIEQAGRDAVAPVSQKDIDAYRNRDISKPALSGIDRKPDQQASPVKSEQSQQLLGLNRITEPNGVTTEPVYGAGNNAPSDPNIYGPGGVNYGSNPDQEQVNQILGIKPESSPVDRYKQYLDAQGQFNDRERTQQEIALRNFGTILPGTSPANFPDAYRPEELAQQAENQAGQLGLQRDTLKQQGEQFNKTQEGKDSEQQRKLNIKKNVANAISDVFNEPPPEIASNPDLLNQFNARRKVAANHVLTYGTEADKKSILEKYPDLFNLTQ